MKYIALWIVIIIIGGFIYGVILAYIRLGLKGYGWSLCELARDIRWFIEYDVIDLPWKFFYWIKKKGR